MEPVARKLWRVHFHLVEPDKKKFWRVRSRNYGESPKMPIDQYVLNSRDSTQAQQFKRHQSEPRPEMNKSMARSRQVQGPMTEDFITTFKECTAFSKLNMNHRYHYRQLPVPTVSIWRQKQPRSIWCKDEQDYVGNTKSCQPPRGHHS